MRGRTALRKTGKAVAVPPPVDVTGAPSAYFLRKRESQNGAIQSPGREQTASQKARHRQTCLHPPFAELKNIQMPL